MEFLNSSKISASGDAAELRRRKVESVVSERSSVCWKVVAAIGEEDELFGWQYFDFIMV